MRVHELKLPTNRSFVERLRLAAVTRDGERYEELLSDLREGISGVDRSSEDTLLKIGLVFLQRGESDLAIEILSLNAERFPESAAAHNFLGMAYREKGNRDRALECFQESVTLDPEYVDAVENLEKMQR